MSASNLTEGQRERLRNTREEVSEDVIEDIKNFARELHGITRPDGSKRIFLLEPCRTISGYAVAIYDEEPDKRKVKLNLAHSYEGLRDNLAEKLRAKTTAESSSTTRGEGTLLTPSSTPRMKTLSPHNRQISIQAELERGKNEEDFEFFTSVSTATHSQARVQKE